MTTSKYVYGLKLEYSMLPKLFSYLFISKIIGIKSIYCQVSTSVWDTKPDPDCMRIQLGLGIRVRIGIRIQEGKTEPQKR